MWKRQSGKIVWSIWPSVQVAALYSSFEVLHCAPASHRLNWLFFQSHILETFIMYITWSPLAWGYTHGNHVTFIGSVNSKEPAIHNTSCALEWWLLYVILSRVNSFFAHSVLAHSNVEKSACLCLIVRDFEQRETTDLISSVSTASKK